MFQALLTAVAALADSLAYRLRGGGFITFKGDTPPRLIWAGTLALSYVLVTGLNFYVFFAASLIVTGFLAVAIVPHAYCQNMGYWPSPQKKWPSFFLKTIDQATWTAWPQWKRTAYDFVSMAGVGFFRGVIGFALYTVLGGGLIPAVFGVAVLTIGSPIAYLVGHFFPLTIGKSLTKDGTEWGEFFTGTAWAAALAVAQWI